MQSVLVLGVSTGMAYGLLAVGLVLVYRSSGILNFAHAEVGAFGAAVLVVATGSWDLPYWLALPIGLAAAGAAGAAVEAGVVRRLRRAPRVMTVVGTLGAGQFLVFTAVAIAGERGRSLFPQPPGFPALDLAGVRLTPAHTAIVVLAPALVVALNLFLHRSRAGLALRGTGADEEEARASGVHVHAMTGLSWALAGVAAGLATALFYPSTGVVSPEAAAPALLVRALGAAALAGMTSLPRAMVAGVGIGVVEQAVVLNARSLGAADVVVFAVVVAGLWICRPAGPPEASRAWTAMRTWGAPESAREVALGRRLSRLAAVTALAGAALVPLAMTSRVATVLTGVLALGLVGLAVGLLTGLSGQLSLGQVAVAGVGAAASYLVTARTGNFLAGFGAAGATGAVVSVVVGLPALRCRRLPLAVGTLAFAVAAEGWLLRQPWLLGAGVDPGRPVLGSFRFDTAKRYYLFALVVTVAATWLYRNLRAGEFGRVLVAVRDNERAARALGITPALSRLEALAAAGILAGLGGAVYGHGLAPLSAGAFGARVSVDVVAMAALGGLGTVAGPMLGAFYVIGVPALVPLDAAGLAATALGWLLLVLYVPAGLPALLRPVRARLMTWLGGGATARNGGVSAGSSSSTVTAPRRPDLRPPPPSGGVALELVGLSKRFDGIIALDAVSVRIGAGECVVLVGPNGAGKTTLLDVISGFVAPDAGRVLFDGDDVTSQRATRRAGLGLARSFQDPQLFPTLTVLEVLRLAARSSAPVGVVRSALTGPGRRGQVDVEAAALIDSFGLGPHAYTLVGELSTGVRRVVELAGVAARRPRLLLLDEPSAGLAQSEVDMLTPLLEQVRRRLGATLVVVEHDVHVGAALADRVVAMTQGRVVAEGSPAEVLRGLPAGAPSVVCGDARLSVALHEREERQ